jgi:endonuclease YncB( thermonuclease family)
VTAVLPPVPAPEVVNATVEGWHDGDTVTVWVHRGGSDYSRWNVRLRGAATRELDEPGGQETAAELNRRYPAGTRVVLLDVGDDKYGGRKLARVIAAGSTGSVDVAAQLVVDGWAMTWNGRGEQPRIPWSRSAPVHAEGR